MKLLSSHHVEAQREKERKKDLEIQRLTLENRKLTTANNLLKAAQTALSSRHGTTSLIGSSSHSLAVSSQHSYAQPTVASRSKVKPNEEQPTPIDHPREIASHQSKDYVNGRLLEDIGYLQPTKATSSKINRFTANVYRGWEADHSEVADYTETEAQTVDPSTSSFSPEAPEDSSDILNEKKTDSIKERTRLHDTDFYSPRTPASMVLIPLKLQESLLQRALSLARETFWHYLNTHYPEIRHRYYPYGPEQIRFGRTELEYTALSRYLPIETSVLGVVYLRNAFCHLTPARELREIDHNLSYAQWLACDVQDEERAVQIRALRDELQREAQLQFDQIKGLVHHACLTGAEVWDLWEMHHQDTFWRVLYETRHGHGDDYDPALQLAAESWEPWRRE